VIYFQDTLARLSLEEETMPNNGLDIATLLARTGGAISQDGSWQQNLAQAAGETAANEQERQFLADMLGGGVPDPTGRFGLSPDTVLKGLQLRHQIEQSRPKEVPMSTIEDNFLPSSVQVPTEDRADYLLDLQEAKSRAKSREAPPSDVEVFEWYDKQDPEVQKKFREYMKTQRGKSFGEALAEMKIEMKERAKTKQEINLGSADDIIERIDRLKKSPATSRAYNEQAEQWSAQGKPVRSKAVFDEMQAINETMQEMEDELGYSNVRYGRGNKGVGFYGTKDGEEVLIQKYQPRAR